LNPVAVLITKALIEIPPKFAGLPPVNPEARKKLDHSKTWHAAEGLAEDVRYYGKWMRDEAEKRIGHLYPKVRLPKEQGGGEATVIAWLWARSVKCPNPACGAQMPLVRSFWLSTKVGKRAWVEPVIDKARKTVRFEVRSGTGQPPESPKIGRGARFRCLVCGEGVHDQHIKDEGLAKRMGAQLMAIVAEGKPGRIYLPPMPDRGALAASPRPKWEPAEELPYEPRAIWCTLYGLNTYRDLFTPRQLVALVTFCDLVCEMRDRVLIDAHDAGVVGDGDGIKDSSTGARGYADAVATYLGLIASKATVFNNTLARWRPGEGKSAPAFGRQGIPMVWDYAEVNPFAGAGGDFQGISDGTAKVIATLPAHPIGLCIKNATI
jgi:putative DNA methylase